MKNTLEDFSNEQILYARSIFGGKKPKAVLTLLELLYPEKFTLKESEKSIENDIPNVDTNSS